MEPFTKTRGTIPGIVVPVAFTKVVQRCIWCVCGIAHADGGTRVCVFKAPRTYTPVLGAW